MSERDRAAERAVAVAGAMGRHRQDRRCWPRARRHRPGRVERIKERLLLLAERGELFRDEDFPPPDSPQSSVSYRIAQNDDDELALYVQCVADGTSAPPHEHTTWAVIVGLRGQELNRLYGPCAGGGEPQVQHEVVVERGSGVAMLGDDVHSIHIEGARDQLPLLWPRPRKAQRPPVLARPKRRVARLQRHRPHSRSPPRPSVPAAHLRGRRRPAKRLLPYSQLRQGALGRDEVEALQDQVLDVAPGSQLNGRPYSIAARRPEDESRRSGWKKPLEALRI